jgi:hypothetical protein
LIFLEFTPTGKTKVLPPFLAYCGFYWGLQRAAFFIYTLRVPFRLSLAPFAYIHGLLLCFSPLPPWVLAAKALGVF